MDNIIREYFTEKVLNEAVALYSICIPGLKELDGFENFIYEFERSGKAYILRISHTSRRTKSMIEAEMHWIEYLFSCSVEYDR